MNLKEMANLVERNYSIHDNTCKDLVTQPAYTKLGFSGE